MRAAEFAKEHQTMTLRQERLEERRQELIPEMRKAREIVDKAEAEGRNLNGR
jgi:hypothetical protein